MRLVILLLCLLCPARSQANHWLYGADVSALPHQESAGAVFLNNEIPTDCLTILREKGMNTLRLRLWHSPAQGRNGLPEALVLAQRAQTAGFDILLDFHYSDTWADPGHQSPPRPWANLEFSDLVDSVRAYTSDVLQALAARGVVPSMVQLGNEVSSGLLWDFGRVGGEFDTPQQWDQLAALLKSARQGVLEAYPAGPHPEIMIHLDAGGNNRTCRWFFDNLKKHQVDFDVIGLSYYPWWHGSLSVLEANLQDLALRYGKDLVVVESAYPWTLQWFDKTPNLVGKSDQLLPGYPATPQGQADFLAKLQTLVRGIPRDKGRGVLWWAPAWVLDSPWENLTLFDEHGNALPALDSR